MRRIACIVINFVALGCGPEWPEPPGAGTDTGTSTGAPTSSASSGGTTGDGGLCEPGAVEMCECPMGGVGTKSCNPNGDGFGPCQCADLGDCDDRNEPNDDEATAVQLGEQACQDPHGLFTGVLGGDDDEDWYTYHGVFSMQCVVEVDAIQELMAPPGVRMCAFFDCSLGDPSPDCYFDALQEQSPEGLPGCCGEGQVVFWVRCSAGGPDGHVLVRIDHGPPDVCSEYSVEYRYGWLG